MNLEEKVKRITELIKISQEKDFSEEELWKLVFDLLANERGGCEKNQEEVKTLLIKLAKINKSTYFGCNFYAELLKSGLSFAQQVFEKAVYLEPYYNCQPHALSGYFITTLKNNGIQNSELFKYLANLNLDETEAVESVKKDLIKNEDWKNIKTAIIFGLNRSNHMSWSALKGAVIFQEDEVTVVLKKALAKEISVLNVLTKPVNDDKEYYNFIFLRSSNLACALYKITKEEKYKKISALLNKEKEFVAGRVIFAKGVLYKYHLRYVGVQEQLERLVN